MIDERHCVEEFDGDIKERNDCADECKFAESPKGSNKWDELIRNLYYSANFVTTAVFIRM